MKKPLAVVAAPTINTPRPGAQVQRSKPFWQIRLERAAAAAAAEAAVAEAAAAVEAAAAEEEPEERAGGGRSRGGDDRAQRRRSSSALRARPTRTTVRRSGTPPRGGGGRRRGRGGDAAPLADLLADARDGHRRSCARASCRGIVRPRHPSTGAAPEARQSAAEVAAAEAAAAAALAAAAEAALAEARRENEDSVLSFTRFASPSCRGTGRGAPPPQAPRVPQARRRRGGVGAGGRHRCDFEVRL